MSDQTCDCCESAAEQSTDRTSSADRWLDKRRVMNAPLPPDLTRRMNRLLGEDSLETFDDFVTAIREATGGGSLTVDDLCHAARETPHRATLDGETSHFQCFYDAVVLAHLADESVEIHTESPANEMIEMRASPDGDVDITPSDAVMSFGIAADVTLPTDGRLHSEEVFTAVCPHVKAFSTRDGCERWAESVDGATVGMPLEAGVSIAVEFAK
jgi:alkylmercury lyase